MKNNEKVLDEIEFTEATEEDNSSEVRKKVGRNNIDRAELGQVALATCPDEDNARTAVVDTLANIMHFCRITGIDFDSAKEMAEVNFNCETDGSY